MNDEIKKAIPQDFQVLESELARLHSLLSWKDTPPEQREWCMRNIDKIINVILNPALIIPHDWKPKK